MERGTVTHVSVNARNNRYGFILTDAGDEVHFNEFGGRYRIVFSNEGLDFARDWNEGLASEVHASPFPEVGDVVLFARHPAKQGKRDTAWTWCRVRPPRPYALLGLTQSA